MEKVWKNADRRSCIDIHCHILPQVDDGAQSIEQSAKMLSAAKKNGIKAVVATPHVRSRDFDFGYADEQFAQLKSYADGMDIALYQGFEVNCDALIDFGFDKLNKMCFRGSDCFLLEFKNYSLPPNWQLIIKKLLAEGLQVIIAHPERYDFIQRDIDIARRMADMGCMLQCDSFPFDLGRFDRQRRAAYKLVESGLVSWIATDAHSPGHYSGYAEVFEDFKDDLRNSKITFGGFLNEFI